MDKDTILKYSPIIVVVIAVLLQWQIFATPKDVQNTKDVIIEKIAREYVTKVEYQALQKQSDNISIKIDKIYDYIMRKN